MSIASKPAQSVADAAPSPAPGGASEATHQPGARTPEAELAAVREMAEPLVRSHGVALVEVVWASGSQGRILRITIERPLLDMAVGSGEAMARSGVTLDDCVRVSRELSSLLDTDEVVAGPFSLEVSSPGLDRPLSTPQDFRRHVGLVAKVKLREAAVDGQMVLRGTIAGCEQQLVLVVDGNTHHVALDNITRARLVFMPQKGEKKGAKRRRRRAAGGDR